MFWENWIKSQALPTNLYTHIQSWTIQSYLCSLTFSLHSLISNFNTASNYVEKCLHINSQYISTNHHTIIFRKRKILLPDYYKILENQAPKIKINIKTNSLHLPQTIATQILIQYKIFILVSIIPQIVHTTIKIFKLFLTTPPNQSNNATIRKTNFVCKIFINIQQNASDRFSCFHFVFCDDDLRCGKRRRSGNRSRQRQLWRPYRDISFKRQDF
eukprot:TRINITY_DN25765_c0_g1_i2.p1 TRINITY_DN25765_c0_g1~~TRINITY_DN25765_c0_g1_i2.p1  ORF type:complete len:215 (+),score=-16.45 TRINITY_DN25765_c0_g1_i2:288-932(+)